MFKRWYAIVCWSLGLLFVICQFFGCLPIDPTEQTDDSKTPGRTVRNNRSAHKGFFHTVFTGK